MKKFIYLIVGALMITLLAEAWLAAQTSFATITGMLKDPSAAIVPGAAITATNEKTGVSRTTTTDPDGNYVVPSLLPSVYTITVELKGFKRAVRSGITLDVNQTLRVDITLEVCEVT